MSEQSVQHSANTTLYEVATRFLAQLPPEESQRSQQEVHKFVRWCGRERTVAGLTVAEVARYADDVVASGNGKRLEPVRAFLSYIKKERLTAINLAVHLRVRKPSTKTNLSLRGIPAKTISLTSEGYSALETELEALKRERPRIAEELRRAAADKDFRENAPLDAAREHQGQVEARIRELEATLKDAIIAQGGSEKKVALGAKIALRDLIHDEELRYTLVAPREADPMGGKISVASPLGKALLNQAEGEVVEVEAPVGTLRYHIEKVEG
ncbi:MAG: transcription elongation factor GreA [Chloroflexi bacterium]|nr:transcription elongation factor GreA [Chloroflexota bacterium]